MKEEATKAVVMTYAAREVEVREAVREAVKEAVKEAEILLENRECSIFARMTDLCRRH